MHLENDVDHGKRIDPDCRYCYLPGTGPVQLDNSGDGVWVHGSTLLALDTGKVRANRERKEAKALTADEIIKCEYSHTIVLEE